MTATTLAAVPAHVPADRVVDFDFHAPPDGEYDMITPWKRLQDGGPDIVWTPRNGGHWIVTRAEDIAFVQKNHDPFSMREVTLPAGAKPMRILPLESDPPEHTDYRSLFNAALSPKVVRAMEPALRELTVSLIEGFRQNGACEFVGEFALKFPITIFLKLIDLPADDVDELLAWTEQVTRPTKPGDLEEGFRKTNGYVSALMAARRAKPGDDLVTQIINAQVFDRAITEAEARSLILLLLFGGLDTVASGLGMSVYLLARTPSLRKQLAERPELIPNAVEELLRLHAPSSTARVVSRDFEYKGVVFKENDRVYVRALLHNLDERKFTDPLQADFERKNAGEHASFGNGPHRCAGAMLARKEFTVFLEEWFKRIPDFSLKPGARPTFKYGMVNCITSLPLVWPVDAVG